MFHRFVMIANKYWPRLICTESRVVAYAQQCIYRLLLRYFFTNKSKILLGVLNEYIIYLITFLLIHDRRLGYKA